MAQTVKSLPAMQEMQVPSLDQEDILEKGIATRSRAFLVAQTVKILPAMRETGVRTLGWEDSLEKEMATHSSIVAWKSPWMEEPGGLHTVYGVTKNPTRLKLLHFMLIIGLPWWLNSKESACRAEDKGLISGLERSPGEGSGNPSSILVWEIPRTEESGGLHSMGSQRVRHN